MNHLPRRAFALASLASCLLAANAAQAAPNFQMPFACNDVWVANTWDGHKPGNSVDMNRPAGDSRSTAGSTVVASAAGTVVTSTYSNNTGYGNYIVIDHGGGWKTLHAHLQSRAVSAGASVRQGQKIGAVGNTSALYNLAPHLHYEQIYNGAVQKATWNGVALRYFEKKNYKSQNSCGSGGGVTGTVKTAGLALNVRSGPGTNYSIVDSVANGSTVSIRCQKTGESISGTYGTSNIWNNIGASGSNKYIPDAYTHTGSDGRVAPDC
ncbi:M23 family metallopeptidase [Lysobacter gummosus]|uniref:Peptidoglycan DD-metalloendopeptidase family protein n=1 Tax=Lysobacter gummosus TaxID=262324 RepID=A0ABY3XB74_9GAMM|nr:M23 family metallopeptidase [Lysobacter gummosus]ALN93188.1 peptidase M23 family protein [Lysobacter gummosus]UNP28691.1 peptidoglycan DD-metalloendopeptidase family protein [Lysobacter gummosus]